MRDNDLAKQKECALSQTTDQRYAEATEQIKKHLQSLFDTLAANATNFTIRKSDESVPSVKRREGFYSLEVKSEAQIALPSKKRVLASSERGKSGSFSSFQGRICLVFG